MALINIYGSLTDPSGAPVVGARIIVAAQRNSDVAFKDMSVSQVTGDDGAYAFSLAPGYYRVLISYNNDRRNVMAGQMYVQEGDEPGTLNDFVQFAEPVLMTPTLRAEIKAWYEGARNIAGDVSGQVVQATDAAKEALKHASDAAQAQTTTTEHSGTAMQAATQSEASKQAAILARDEAESFRDAAQYAAATSGMVKDIASGLASTTSGQSFSVAQGTESDVAIRTYLNNSGVAQETSRIIGKSAIDQIAARVSQDETSALQFLASNGVIGRFRKDATLEIIALESGEISSPRISATEFSAEDMQSVSVSADTVKSTAINLGSGTTVTDGTMPFLISAQNGPVLAWFNDALRGTALDFNEILINGTDIQELFNQQSASPQYPKEPTGIVDGYEHIPYYGQSQVIGTTNGVIHNYDFDSKSLMLNGGLRTKNTAGSDPGVTEDVYYTGLKPVRDRSGETFIPGHDLAYRKFLDTKHPERNVTPVWTLGGQGGSTVVMINKGTTAYNELIKQWTGTINSIKSAGGNYRNEAMVYAQGGSDDGIATPPDTWEAQVTQLRKDINADVKAATGVTINPAVIFPQINNYMRYPALNGRPNIGLKQYELATERDGWFGACPTYILDFIDVAHWTKESQVKVGAYIDRVHRNILLEGGTWKPLHPSAFYMPGDGTVTIKFHMPNGGRLVLDKTTVSEVMGAGFAGVDAAGVKVIPASAVLVSDDTIRLTFSSGTGSLKQITYAQVGQVGDPNATDGSGLGRKNGVRGNLRDNAGDSDNIDINGVQYPLHNWCWMFTHNTGQ